MKSQHRSPYKEALDKLYNYLSGFVPLTAAEFQQILPYLEIREYEKKAVVVKVGEIERYINLIVRGLARKFITVKNDEITLQLATEGHVVHSELSFHTQTPSGSAVETIEPTTFISISYDNMQE